MKIDCGGTPIWISPRRIGGVEIIQGTSRLKLRDAEIPALVQALNEMSRDAREGKRMTTSEFHA